MAFLMPSRHLFFYQEVFDLKCRSRLLCSLFLVLFCLSGSAWAIGLGGPAYSVAPLSGNNVVYTTSENFTSGTLGVLNKATGVVSSKVVTNLGGDAVAFSFSVDGKDRIFLANRLNYGASTEATVYDPTDWSVKWNETLTGNVHGVTTTSKGLFIAYYGSGSALGWVEKRSLDDYSSVVLSKDIVPVASEDKGVSILSANGDSVYLLVQGFEKYSSSYDKGAVYELDENLSVTKSVDLGINPVSLSTMDGDLYAACNGGYSSSKDGAYVIDMDDFSKNEVVFSNFKDSNEYISGFYPASSSTGFLVTSVMDSETYATTNRIYLVSDSDVKTATSTVTLSDPASEIEGYLGTVKVDGDGTIWACAGNGESGSMVGISKDGSSVVKYTSEESSSSSSSGGGCSIGFAPSVLLLLAPILFFSKNR